MNIKEWTNEIHQNAVEHGWWKEERSFGDIIALIISEPIEALEEYRNAHHAKQIYFNCANKESCCYQLPTGLCGSAGYREICCEHAKPEGIPVELADCIIRILDFCGKEGIDIENAIKMKHNYNKTRPYKHGGKVI